MPIFVFTILTPTLAFYVYALVQFWAEFRRRRRGEMKVVALHETRLAPGDFEPFPEAEAEPEPAKRSAAEIRPFVLPAASAPILIPYLNHPSIARAVPSRAPAMKRAAKG